MTKIKSFNADSLNKKFKKINWQIEGRVCNVVGTIIEAMLPESSMGTVCKITLHSQSSSIFAEVVGFHGEKALLFPFSSDLTGVHAGAAISIEKPATRIPVGDFLIGKIIDPFMKPLSGEKLQIPATAPTVPIENDAPNPLARSRIENPLSLGVRAIDGALTFGEGQRIGIMAGSGVGKSILLGMIAQGSSADINIIGLIGERGREVREFIERDLGPAGLSRSVVVVVTSDQSPLMRIRAAKVCTAMAEYFSSLGKKVLLMMDSLTRVAQARREIGIACGEPVAQKGYPPSALAILPKLLERCGPQAHGHGSISGLYTVLVDGDDLTSDPVGDNARAILDGHIMLTRELAAKAHYPAIDIPSSASRVMRDIVSDDHWQLANDMKELIAIYRENYELLQVGGYKPGTNPTIDAAMALMPAIEAYLKQDYRELTSLQDAIQGLMQISQHRQIIENRGQNQEAHHNQAFENPTEVQ